MAITTSTNMLLTIPSVGTEAGPQYAQDINTCLTIIDQHNHTPGSGVQIPASGLNINSDLPINANNLTTIRSVRFTPQSTVIIGAADLGCLYEVTNDLYFNDGLGNNIRITQNGAVGGTPGSIANLVSPASAAYSSSTQTFIFQSAANTSANMDIAALTLRNLVANSHSLTLAPPSAMGADTTISLPALPGAQSFVTLDNTGAMTAGIPTSQGITLAMLAATVIQALNPAGTVIASMCATAPAGYLLCDGSAISRTTYATLYTAIGNASGPGDGSTTFNLPDLQGLFLRGVANSSGNDPDKNTRVAQNPGGNTGNNVGSAQDDQYFSHTHGFFTGGTGGTSGGSAIVPNNLAQTNASGGNETRPKNVYVNYYMKF